MLPTGVRVPRGVYSSDLYPYCPVRGSGLCGRGRRVLAGERVVHASRGRGELMSGVQGWARPDSDPPRPPPHLLLLQLVSCLSHAGTGPCPFLVAVLQLQRAIASAPA